MIAPDLDLELPHELGATHFVGIGGSGMSGIARLFLDAGHRVTGSDARHSDAIDVLRGLGAEIAIGHDAANLGPDVDAVVVTGALWADNPEYTAALERGIPVLHRANALHWLTRGHRVVAVAGAHGKSTTTGMIVTALRELGEDPSFVNGGVVAGYGTSSSSGADDTWVIEADESDGSFLLYDTAVALITNLDDDHLDHYGTEEAYADAFVRFARSAREIVIASADDPGVREVLRRLEGATPVLTFGRAEGSDVRILALDADAAGVSVRVRHAGLEHAFRIGVPGEHNGVNAVGALALLIGTGHDAAASARALEAFRGTGRRFEPHGEVRGVRVYDDYAHHPTEVDVTLRAAREVAEGGRVIAVHQPHLFSRTQQMAGEFAHVYETLADHTVVLGVFGAREDPIPGVTGALVAERFSDPGRVEYLPDWQEAADRVAGIAREGDLVLTLSCGDVYRIIPQLLASLERIPQSVDAPTPG